MAEEKGWEWLGRLLLAKNLWVWLWPLIGGPVTFYGLWLWSHAKHLVGPEIFVLSLWAVIGVLLAPVVFSAAKDYWSTPKIKGTLVSVDQQGDTAKLTFNNAGIDGDFFAKCEFIGKTNVPNPLPKIKYDLKWEGQTEKLLPVLKNDSAHLLIANWCISTTERKVEGSVRRYEFGTAQFKSGNTQQVEGCFGWAAEPNEKLPSYVIKVTVQRKSGRGSLERLFTVGPEHYYGPLQIRECTYERGRDVSR